MLGFFSLVGLFCYIFIFIFIYLFFQILVQNVFLGFFYFYFFLESRINNFFNFFYLRVFLILVEGVPNFFLRVDKYIYFLIIIYNFFFRSLNVAPPLASSTMELFFLCGLILSVFIVSLCCVVFLLLSSC